MEALTLVLVIGFLDYIGGRGVSMFLFYAAPILLVAWFAELPLAILCATLCTIMWFLANKDVHPYGTLLAYSWATFNRLVYFLFVAIGGSAVKTQQEEIRARMEALMRTSELEKEIVRVSEHEQMRIGQDLHDSLCQNLAAINCAAACLTANLQAKSSPEAEAADVIQKLLREAVIEARDLAHGIFPIQMDPEGLPAALEELVARTNRHRPPALVALEVNAEVKIEDPQLSMHLYRIAQQALSNALTHAHPTRIVLRLNWEGRRLTLSITDDGCGFSAAEPSRGIGLQTMRYRAHLIGAEIAVKSTPTTGTEVCCSVDPPTIADAGRIQPIRDGDSCLSGLFASLPKNG